MNTIRTLLLVLFGFFLAFAPAQAQSPGQLDARCAAEAPALDRDNYLIG